MKRGSAFGTSSGWKGFMVSLALIQLGLAHAQEEPKPCGTITKNVRLTSNCAGPLVIGANNITVDLNGHTVLPADLTGVEVFNKHGVTVKNGTIKGLQTGLYVKKGHHNTFRDLVVDIDVGVGTTTVVLFEDVRDMRVMGLKAFAFEDVGCLRFTGKRSTLTRLSLSNTDGSALAYIRGSELTISKSTLKGGFIHRCTGAILHISDSVVRDNLLQGAHSEGLCLEGDRNQIRGNVMTSSWVDGLTLVSGERNVFSHNQVTAEKENPPEVVDINGGLTACKNTWRHNEFTTDSEGDGPTAGCIQ